MNAEYIFWAGCIDQEFMMSFNGDAGNFPAIALRAVLSHEICAGADFSRVNCVNIKSLISILLLSKELWIWVAKNIYGLSNYVSR
jgi:hypothetical protein